jgi:hypothetical protein
MLFDVTTPYGYGGPVDFGASPPWEAFHSAYGEWCREHRIVTTFVRFHPLYGNHRNAAPQMHLEHLAGTVGWRIDAGTDLLAGMRPNHRWSVGRAIAGGLSILQREAGDEGVERFRALYRETMRRVGATSYYDFPDPYWQVLRSALGSDLRLVEAMNERGEVLASALLLWTAPWVHYHLAGSSEKARASKAHHLLLMEVARTAQESGLSVFHLGGGVNGEADGLMRFKLNFDPGGLREAFVGKQIHDLVTYRRLTGTVETRGRFPRYRQGKQIQLNADGLSFNGPEALVDA